MSLEAELRDLVREIVRDELRKALAEVARPEQYLATRAAAELAAVAEGTIRRWIREGRLVGHRAGRTIRVLRSDLESLLADGRSAGAVDPTPEDLAKRDFG